MSDDEKLEAYCRKRDFAKTSEPEGSSEKKRQGKSRLSIRKHKSKRLHYDLLLEVDGVLKSWAVPRGPSVDTKEKRLAVFHPIESKVMGLYSRRRPP